VRYSIWAATQIGNWIFLDDTRGGTARNSGIVDDAIAQTICGSPSWPDSDSRKCHASDAKKERL